ncbi:MAG: cyclic nucleotide-binding domain-containing protein, partial [Myxococcales bacterium]|nr:cyclic nucleotide-binding domain-containing protein [Myxococcales bacterium]
MTTEDSVLSAITDSHLFASLDDEGRRRLMDGARTVHFDGEQVIVREGDPGEALYVVKDGKVRVTTTKDGVAVHLATLERGACFGEVSLLSGRPRTATVVADGRCTMLAFSRVQIEELLDAFPKVRRRLETMVIGRAKDTMRKLTRPLATLRRPSGE